MECSICCEKFNKSNHFKIECKTCKDNTIVSCRECCKKYLINSPNISKCMICKIEWDKEFLFNNFTKLFINNELKEIKQTVLLEKEIAKLPDTQIYAKKMKKIRELEKNKKRLKEQEIKLKTELKKVKNEMFSIDIDISSAQYNTKEHSTFSKKCPIDNCKGFLDSKYDCGLCLNKICKHCMEIKQEEHECDSEKIETIKLLKKDTKGCPKCGQLIFKIDGCDQMWCPPCHTAFSWRTGIVEEGNVHNPEYYRWMRENNSTLPRNPGDEPYDPCGNNLINISSLVQILREHFPYKNDYSRIIDCDEVITIINMHRTVRHIDMIIVQNHTNTLNINNKLRDLRVYYLLNEIGKEKWKRKLQTYDKKQEKDNCYMNVWNLLKIVIVEYLGKIVENRYSNECGLIIKDIINESKKIRLHCNKSFERIGKNYSCVYPGITKEWIING